jgi:1,4-dihydroxy-2-naphthoate octaprenyltransferase
LFRLSYKGLGEPLCFLAFGPSATPAFYLALQPAILKDVATVTMTAAKVSGPASLTWPALQQSAALHSVPAFVWGLSVLVGVSTTIILFTSHFHQIEGDRAAGKQSPLVRLGVERGVGVLSACVIGLYVLIAVMVACNVLPPVVLGSALLFSLGPAKALVDFAEAHRLEPARLALLKRFACVWHIALGISLAFGLTVAHVIG